MLFMFLGSVFVGMQEGSFKKNLFPYDLPTLPRTLLTPNS